MRSEPKPYFKEGMVTLYHGDARTLVPRLGKFDAIITDPIWPNCEHIFPGVDAGELLNAALRHSDATRVVIHLGMNSDPRFLQAVPERWRYLRTCYLEYALVGYLGRLLRDADVAYVFGPPPPSKEGARCMPGRIVATKSNGDKKWKSKGRTQEDVANAVGQMQHPTQRNLQHVRWLAKWFGGQSVLDPFIGSGTTALACKSLGIACVGIDIEERYLEYAADRLRQSVLELEPSTHDI